MISVHTVTEVGGHRRNEDAFVVQPHPSTPDRLLVCLADGQGGAAEESALARLSASAPERLDNPGRWSALVGPALTR